MLNQKYYQDIKRFPSQFQEGLDLVRNLNIDGEFKRVMVCGVGGSSLYVELINNYLEATGEIQIEVSRSYSIPKDQRDDTLFVIASYSGNTEETISCFEQVKLRGYKSVILTSGGKLNQLASEKSLPIIKLPTGIQPRLATGYIIGALVKLLSNLNLISDKEKEILSMAKKIEATLDEDKTKDLALRIKGKVPIIYSTENNFSIARISKIKFNENAKTQAFWNFFPELNHNEMVGFTNLVMKPFFIIFKSKFTHERNHKRIEIFKKITQGLGAEVEVLDMVGENVLEEMINAYYFIDHVTFYLAEAYGIDPEPVEMVEQFKQLLNQ